MARQCLSCGAVISPMAHFKVCKPCKELKRTHQKVSQQKAPKFLHINLLRPVVNTETLQRNFMSQLMAPFRPDPTNGATLHHKYITVPKATRSRITQKEVMWA